MVIILCGREGVTSPPSKKVFPSLLDHNMLFCMSNPVTRHAIGKSVSNYLYYCRIDTLTEALEGMDLSEEQMKNKKAFLAEKRKIVEQGEMKEQHFLRMAELGFGNGGVVLKVEHKPTGIIMARKVGDITGSKITLLAV